MRQSEVGIAATITATAETTGSSIVMTTMAALSDVTAKGKPSLKTTVRTGNNTYVNGASVVGVVKLELAIVVAVVVAACVGGFTLL